MADILWTFRRLKAMNIPEIKWRFSQKWIEKKEKTQFEKQQISVADHIFCKEVMNLSIEPEKLHLNFNHKEFSLNNTIHLLGNYDYRQYKKDWDYGFQTENRWPSTFSYSLNYKQRDDIGDARTNWELNRHFQFPILAKNYVASGNKDFLLELMELFEDWNDKNPFLWGISWTSVMEIAIRCSNWCYTYCFLAIYKEVPEQLLLNLKTGILNMTAYIANHYSRYSSANNHLIVEAYALGQSGILFNHEPWITLSKDILTKELVIQNYSDGINKELSLHYQSFYMEAMGLTMRLFLKNEIEVPEIWKSMLEKMSQYLFHCQGKYGEVVEFGDNDEGKILELYGKVENHYQYVLELMSFLLKERYVALNQVNETIHWLFEQEDFEDAKAKPLYQSLGCISYKEGGNTIFRSQDEKILMGIDHAELGFGSIAAHGHADALSFQLFLEGKAMFVDPGTYLYHCDLTSRNEYRMTKKHNTACIHEADQSEMLGAFLWGKRAECQLLNFEEQENCVRLSAEHNGYESVLHKREYIFDKYRLLEIVDTTSKVVPIIVNYTLASGIVPKINGNQISFKFYKYFVYMDVESNNEIQIASNQTMYSKKYGVQETTTAICITGCTDRIKTTIRMESI